MLESFLELALSCTIEQALCPHRHRASEDKGWKEGDYQDFEIEKDSTGLEALLVSGTTRIRVFKGGLSRIRRICNSPQRLS